MNLKKGFLAIAMICLTTLSAVAVFPVLFQHSGIEAAPTQFKAETEPSFVLTGDPVPGGGIPNGNRTGG